MRTQSKSLLLIAALGLAILAIGFSFSRDKGATWQAASVTSLDANKNFGAELALADSQDFEFAKRGFIASLDNAVIKDSAGKTIYDINSFNFLQGAPPPTVNPSLWRQAKLNQLHGLFKVTDGIYQIRNFDLANMTLVKGARGWIIIDPLLSPETARAGLQLANKQLGELPVTAIIITHSHVDHFGGIRGVVDIADIKSGKIPLYAPEGFYEHAISENVMAGNAMARRAAYMFGNLLPRNANGSVGSGLGQSTSLGTPAATAPTVSIGKQDHVKTIDGLEVQFLYTPESEAPAEMMFYFPKYRAFCQAEVINHTFHNLYTLRGATVRNAQKWSVYIDTAIQKWAEQTEVSFGSHHFPTWGKANIRKFWEDQRDLYRFVHDQTVRLANTGLTPLEIAEQLKLPASLGAQFYNRDYYGTLSHNIKAQYQLYYGWFDGNPANLNPLPPAAVGAKYVELAGGEAALMAKAQAAYKRGEYRWVAELLNHAVFANPDNQSAKQLLADCYEQLGYQAESGAWRNYYLSGAKELRDGVKIMPLPQAFSKEMLAALSTEMLFNYLAMTFDGTDAEAAAMDYQFNFVMPDVDSKLALIVSNGAVTPRLNYQVKNPTATITINRADLDRLSLGEVSALKLLLAGDLQISGKILAFRSFFSKTQKFNAWFNIVTP